MISDSVFHIECHNIIILASLRENLSLGFRTKQDSNQFPQLLGPARKLKVPCGKLKYTFVIIFKKRTA